MYCRNCGKDIGEASFCPHCGQSGNPDAPSPAPKGAEMLNTIKEWIKTTGHSKLISIITGLGAAISVWIRIANNEIITEYYALAQDDYLVISDSGRNGVLAVICVQFLLAGWLCYDAKKADMEIPRSTVIAALLFLAVQVGAMLLRFPAPY